MSGKGKQSSKKAVIKVREGGKSAQSTLNNAEGSPESEDVSTFLSNLKIIDKEKQLPKYCSILQRSSEEGIGMEDLDALQMELEMMLSSVVLRSRALQEEITSFSSTDERRDRRSKSGKGLSQVDKKIRDDKTKAKELNVKTHSPVPNKLFKQRIPGSSLNQLVPNPHELVRVEGKDVPKLMPKNDTPNKFWASVDPYCTDIMPDDIKLLDELIASHSDISEFKKIPPLGRHYSLLWAHNDLLQEEDASNSNREKKKRSDVSLLLAKGEKKTNGISGPLTQRLVSALLEENVYVANNNTDNKLFRDGDPPVLRDLTIQNSMNLELRMHKELVDQGILEPDSQKRNPDDDEILAEIKRCQQELTALSSHNVTQLKRLLNLTQDESKRQSLKRKIKTVDNEVVDHYNKLVLSKQGKMPLSRKEQEKAWACLKERENLLQQLDMLPSNSIGEPIRVSNASNPST